MPRAGCAKMRPDERAVRSRARPRPGSCVAPPPGRTTEIYVRRFRVHDRAGDLRHDLRIHHGRAAGGDRPGAVAARPLTRCPGRVGGGGAALWDGDVDEREGELPRLDPAVAICKEADAAGTVALQRRTVAVPDRLSLHEVGRLVPARQGDPSA